MREMMSKKGQNVWIKIRRKTKRIINMIIVDRLIKSEENEFLKKLSKIQTAEDKEHEDKENKVQKQTKCMDWIYKKWRTGGPKKVVKWVASKRRKT